jgi:vitamin B12 transporter
MHQRSALLICALPLALASPAAQAQERPRGATSELGQVLITGSRLPVTESGLAQNVTVIDQRQLQESAPARLEDILGRVAGVYVDHAGKTGGFSSLYMRGAENSHLLVMVDGVKVNDPTTTRGSAYDLSSIDVHQVERIEILRGPASAIHGGEALSGVVNIVMKKPTGPGVGGSVYGALGQDHYQKLGGSITAGGDVVRGQLSVGRSREGSRGDDDGYLRLNTFSGSLRVTPSAALEGELFVHRAERLSVAFPDDSGGPRLAVNREKTRRDADDMVYGVRFAAGDLKVLRLQAGASVYERDENADNAFVDPGVRFPVPAFTSDTHFRRTTLHATATRAWDFASVVVGLERQNEKGDLTSVGDFDFDGASEALRFGLTRRTDSVFAEGRFQVARPVSLQLGLRRDKVEGLDAETTPHLGAVWELPNGATTLKANYGKGFKPPSFFALGFPIGGNPALRPERSKYAELTVAHRLDRPASSIEVSVFHIDYENLIDFDATTFSNVNRGAVVVKGIEPTLKLRVADRLGTQIGLTLLDIKEKDGLAPLRNRPEKRATASAVYDIDDRSSLFAVVSYTGRYLDRSNPTGDIYLPGFTTVDMAYSMRFGKLRAKLAVDNLLDRDYEQFVGFPARDRRLRVELRADF